MSYIKEIRKIQPHGPYFIVGHSFAGLVTFEMARQFYEQNHNIGLVVLIDTMLELNQNSLSLSYQLSINRLNLSPLEKKQKAIYLLERLDGFLGSL